MQVVVFLDLDDTIFQTVGKCPKDETLYTAAVDRMGKPLSFISESQKRFLEWISKDAIVIPTTARNVESYRRVNLSFHHAAILSFGAVILSPSGCLDAEWDKGMRPQLNRRRADLESLERQTVDRLKQQSSDVRVRLVHDFDMPVYLVAKDPGGDGSKLAHLRDIWQPFVEQGEYFLHWNDNNLSLVPAFLGKEKAVAYVLRRYFDGLSVVTIGVGDSLTDIPFLAQCQFAVMPRRSQLFQSVFLERPRCSAEAMLPKT